MIYIENVLRERTMGMFSDKWYNETMKLMRKEQKKDGYVYFIKNGQSSKRVKIGATYDLSENHLSNIIKSHKRKFDKGVFVIGYIKTNDLLLLEKEIHNYLKESNTRGGFFNISLTDLINIKEMYDLVVKNSYLNNEDVFDLKSNSLFHDLDLDLIDLVKNLEKNKKYTTKNLLRRFNKQSSKEYSKNRSWFGRDIAKVCIHLNINKKTKVENGIRYFVIH